MFTTPLTIFLVLVAPIWLILHYSAKKKVNQGLDKEDLQKLAQLSDLSDKMATRIAHLEAILDEQTPNWRTKK